MPQQRFSYSSTSVGTNQFSSRDTPAKITKVEESITETRSQRPIPGVAITYETPNGTIHTQKYEGTPDLIPTHSPLGKLISAFEGLGVSDIGRDEWEPLMDKFVMLRVQPIKNGTSALTFERYPSRWLNTLEIGKHFGVTVPLTELVQHISLLEEKLDGLAPSLIITKLVAYTELKELIDEINKSHEAGLFVPWLEQRTSLRLNAAGVLVATKQQTEEPVQAEMEEQ